MPVPLLQRAVVVGRTDPLGRRRLLVRLADRPDDDPVWALACVPAGSRSMPRLGAVVWLAREDGDPDSFVWLGILPQPA